MNSEDGVVRQVYIGKYYENGDPLVIRVGVFTPKGDALLLNEKAIVFMTNIIVLNDGTFNTKMGAFINLDLNVSIFAGLNNNLLTNGQKTKNSLNYTQKELESKKTIEKIMISQAYLADEDISNDIVVEQLMTKIILDKNEPPSTKILSMLIKYDYFLSIEDISNAQSLWNEILIFSTNVPGDMNQKSLEQLNGEKIFLMKNLIPTLGEM